MGQKISANALRLGINKDWKSSWFSSSNSQYQDNLIEDIKIKKDVAKAFKQAGLEAVFLKRNGNNIEVEVKVARPGIAIGRGGEGIEKIKSELTKKFRKPIDVKISEVKKSDTSARIIARGIADGIERRQPPKLLMISFKEKAMAAGAKGIKIWVSGRIGGSSQARMIKLSEGPVPLHTFRANIDYAKETAVTMDAGLLGVKVWVYKSEEEEKKE
jgi:small subunit ribosomal protein S3